ncbi:hypothetical protein SXCC_00062 [Gluconacetobacter sp. SXCC-1]|nr:hypothetical protein SXCC_00062 [Gluconacetobacter sp. SXCC-1]
MRAYGTGTGRRTERRAIFSSRVVCLKYGSLVCGCGQGP